VKTALNSIPLLVFAKAPIAGQVKTRLQAECSAQQAAEIAKILLEETLRQTTSNWPGKVIVSVALDISDEFMRALASKYNVTLVAQEDGDLGQSMLAAFDQYGYPAAIIGSDAPHLAAESLKQAFSYLVRGKNVIGPSLDGGYYLIGLVASYPDLFKEVEWGGKQVLATTLKKAQQQACVLSRLAPLNDVDTWADLVDASKQVPRLKQFLKA